MQLMDLLMPRMWAWRKKIDRWAMPRCLAGREDLSCGGEVAGRKVRSSEWDPTMRGP